MNPHRSPRGRTRQFLPQLEGLEDRLTPASIQVFGGIMLITGDSQNNTVVIGDNGAGTVNASITGVGGPITQSASNIRAILVNTQDGADNVTYNLSAVLSTGRALTVNLGRGADTATLNLSPGVGQAALIAAVLGGDDVDTIRANSLGAVAQGGLAYVAADGGRGADDIALTSSGAVNGALVALLSGGDDADRVAANLTVASGSTGYVAGTVLGGSANDNLTFNFNNNSGGAGASTLAAAIAVLDGGSGTDTCTRTANVSAFRCEA